MSIDWSEGLKRWASQPDGRVHLLSKDRWHGACGIRLQRYETRYAPWDYYADGPELCPECRLLLKQRASFPKPATEEQRGAISRIQKLFALSKSPNEAEAALAAARANQLLQKHNLSVNVLEDERQQKAEKRMTDSLGSCVLPHKFVLAQACCDMFDVQCWVTRRPSTMPDDFEGRTQRETHLVFLGLSLNVETAVLTYGYLCAAVDALARSRNEEGAVRGASPLRDYKLGAAERISAMVRDFKTKAAADPSIGALILVGREVARRAYEAEGLGGSNGKRVNTGTSNESAYGLGYADGSQIDPHGARRSRLLTGGE